MLLEVSSPYGDDLDMLVGFFVVTKTWQGAYLGTTYLCIIDATYGSLALKAYQQNLYLKYYY